MTGSRGRAREILRHSSHLILGGARSGKSRHALALAQADGRPAAFVATAEAFDDDMRARIARHRAERPVAWLTVEAPRDLTAACRALAPGVEIALVDCLTLWVSNRLLSGAPDAAILAGADELAALVGERRRSWVVVSNEVGEGVHPSTAEGLRFRDLLGVVNQRIAAAADCVTLMVAGIPLAVKGTQAAEQPDVARGRERAPEAP
jgi:adenosylcobinamide kinase/adenosylcobinamide-phosphate guanylyltransferase